MAGPFDFTNQNIEDTYQRLVQVSGSGFCDGTGSAISLGGNQNLQQVTDQGASTTTPITASIISASGTITGNIGSFNSIEGFIGNDGNNRILTSDGDGTFTAEDSFTLNNGALGGQFTSFQVQSQTAFAFDSVPVNFDSEVTIDGPNGHITASGNISASGTIVGSNLSGTNTGDQNISNLAVTGSDVLFRNITSSANISASNNITANGVTAQININPEFASSAQQHEIIFGEVPDGGGFTTLKAEQSPDLNRRFTYTPSTGIVDIYNLNVFNKVRISGSIVLGASANETQVGNVSDNRTIIESPRLETSNLNVTNTFTGSIHGGTF